jgi:hypothetical protein
VVELTLKAKKDLVREILLKDPIFFGSSKLGFNIFKYTSFFAVYAFLIQIVLATSEYFAAGIYYNIYGIILLFMILLATFIFIILYIEYNFIIKKSAFDRIIYINNFTCKNCDFFSFSSAESIVHFLSNRTHKAIERSYIMRQDKSKESISAKYRRELSKGVNEERNFIIERILVFIGGDFLLFLISLYFDLSAYLLLAANILLVFVLSIVMVLEHIKREKENETENSRVMQLKINHISKKNLSMPEISFELFACGSQYWERVEKINLDEPIITPEGFLYIIDDMKFDDDSGDLKKVILYQ